MLKGAFSVGIRCKKGHDKAVVFDDQGMQMYRMNMSENIPASWSIYALSTWLWVCWMAGRFTSVQPRSCKDQLQRQKMRQKCPLCTFWCYCVCMFSEVFLNIFQSRCSKQSWTMKSVCFGQRWIILRQMLPVSGSYRHSLGHEQRLNLNKNIFTILHWRSSYNYRYIRVISYFGSHSYSLWASPPKLAHMIADGFKDGVKDFLHFSAMLLQYWLHCCVLLFDGFLLCWCCQSCCSFVSQMCSNSCSVSLFFPVTSTPGYFL